jgi:beta-lactamase regulating signal transducer with metallopeptidase domain
MIALAASGLMAAQASMANLDGLTRLATGGLVAAVWQGILLAAAAGLGLRLLPKTPAAVRFAIWFAVFLVVTALPMVSLLPHTAGVAQTAGRSAWLTLDARWSLAITAAWVVASLVRASTLAIAAFRVRALWKRATPVELQTTGVQATGSRRAQLCTSDEVDRPTVIGFFSPKILIPDWLLEKLTAAELEQIVLHESGHLGRADDWMNLLQKIALVVFPLNPALAWVERRLCFERELAVDERVLHSLAGRSGAAKAYAACLTTLAEHRLGRRGLTLALGALGRESELGRRVVRILRRGEAMKPVHARLVLGGAMLTLLAGAVGLERCPQLIGFAAMPQVASRTGWQPTHGDQTAMPILRVSVTSKFLANSNIRKITDVPHETLLVASEPDSLQSKVLEPAPSRQRSRDGLANGSVRMIRTAASDSGSRGRSKLTSDVDPSQPAVGVRQWVVVTAWQGEDGSRMVLTTATTSEPGRDSSDAPATGDAPELRQQRTQQVLPYAAVPVRGGWLVFQL